MRTVNGNRSIQGLTLGTRHCKIAAKSNRPFKWVESALKYLGIWLTPDLTNLYTKNAHPALLKIQQDTWLWNTKPLSWFGRAAVVKMTILPRILYLFHNLPILMPKSFFSQLNKAPGEIIWAGKKPCISMATLPKTEEGINLPNFKHYYATHLTQILDWNCHAASKDWIGIEGLQSNIPLRFIPWVPNEARPVKLTLHPTIGPTLRIFQTVTRQYDIASIPGPLTPLIHNKDFAQGHTTTSFPHRPDSTPVTVSHCVEKGRLKTFDQLRIELQAKHFTFWQYRQLHNYVLCSDNKQHFLRETTFFEQLCL